jgi:hypothetical protein
MLPGAAASLAPTPLLGNFHRNTVQIPLISKDDGQLHVFCINSARQSRAALVEFMMNKVTLGQVFRRLRTVAKSTY